MTNREVRGEAWKLFQKNYVRLIPAMAIQSAIFAAAELADRTFKQSNPVKVPVVSLFLILFAPVLMCGWAVFARAVLKGSAPGVGLLFQPLRDFGKVANIWLAALLYLGPSLLRDFAEAVSNSFGASIPANAARTVDLWAMGAIYLPLSVVSIWLALRLMLYPYAYAKHPDWSAARWLGASWNAMRGRCGQLFRLLLSTAWPILAIMALALLISRAADPTQAQSAGFILQILISSAFVCFYMGYPLLATACFAEDALDEMDGVRKPGGGRKCAKAPQE